MGSKAIGKIKEQMSLRDIVQPAVLALGVFKLAPPSRGLIRRGDTDRREETIPLIGFNLFDTQPSGHVDTS
jgi:hypothetical protein